MVLWEKPILISSSVNLIINDIFSFNVSALDCCHLMSWGVCLKKTPCLLCWGKFMGVRDGGRISDNASMIASRFIGKMPDLFNELMSLVWCGISDMPWMPVLHCWTLWWLARHYASCIPGSMCSKTKLQIPPTSIYHMIDYNDACSVIMSSTECIMVPMSSSLLWNYRCPRFNVNILRCSMTNSQCLTTYIYLVFWFTKIRTLCQTMFWYDSKWY